LNDLVLFVGLELCGAHEVAHLQFVVVSS
jgi:hypothetical protein